MHLIGAITTADPKEIRYIYIWGAILIGVVLIAFFIYSAFKRWMNDTDTTTTAGFGLSDLRRLRDEGKISIEEFELTRAKMIAAAKVMTANMPSTNSRPQVGVQQGSPKPSDQPPTS
jgi:hypothetical protein